MNKLRTMSIVLIVMISVAAISCTEPSEQRDAQQPEQPKNVIFIVPDGCSIPIWAAVRVMTVGADGALNLDHFPVQGRCKTYSADTFITDSAASGTAYACGVKTNNGVIGMDATTSRGDSLTGEAVESVLEAARQDGYATGLVSTAMIQHATPAAFYSHRADRNWYELIANDLVESGVDVIMGGGREYMIPQGTTDSEGGASERTDNRDLLAEMESKGYTVIDDQAGFDALDTGSVNKLCAIFNPGHMAYEMDRADDPAGEPSIREMAECALSILSRNEKGFFLLIESGRIDHAGHDHDTKRFLREGVAFDKMVGAVRAFADSHPGTMVIVVPDHGTGGPHLVGVHDGSGEDAPILSYEEAGFPDYRLDSDGYPVDDGGRPVAIQWVEWGGHTGEDVGVWAVGPGTEKLDALVNNIDVNRIMRSHLRLGR